MPLMLVDGCACRSLACTELTWSCGWLGSSCACVPGSMLCVLRMFVHGTLVTQTSEVMNLQTQRVTCKQALYTGPRVVANVSVTLDGHPLVATTGQPTMLLSGEWCRTRPGRVAAWEHGA